MTNKQTNAAIIYHNDELSWVRVWVDLTLFTTQFFDKVLLDTWKRMGIKGFG